jgi:hypothetical protein
MKLRLIAKKELWVLTRWGWMIVLVGLTICAALYTQNIHSFLSISKPVPAQILALEEWIHPYALESAASEFKDHGYNA